MLARVNADNVLTFLHLLAAFWYAAGLTAVQLPLVSGWRSQDVMVQAAAFEEASHYQGVLLVPGAIVAAASGVFLWTQLGYNLVSTGWLVVLEVLYVFVLLVCLPLAGMGLRRARLAALEARKLGRPTPQLREALADNVPLVFAGIATLLVPVMTYLSVFKPF
ncbi:MAG TPA: DUF2269 family protein [Dehalococcoidia bacterium]|nr:DUF2269 family protein [Dehalococcoidia bacterium]